MPKSDPSQTGFKYQPREMVRSPRQFGKSSAVLEPADGIGLDDPRLGAARLQHKVANSVREALLARGELLQNLVETTPGVPGMSYDRLLRIARGETLMQLADLVNWAARYGEVREVLAKEQFGFETSDDKR